MGGTGKEKTCMVLVERRKGKRQLERSRHRYEEIRMAFREVGWKYAD